MFESAFEWIKKHTAPNILSDEESGRKLSDKELYDMRDPLPVPVKLSTLSGTVNFIKNSTDKFMPGNLIVHVVSEKQVSVFGKMSAGWKQREHYSMATASDVQTFDFGQKLSKEEFMIQVMSRFVESPGRERLLKVAGTMKAEKINESADDGVTQTVSSKMGVMLASETEISNPFNLAPFRTFLEIEQPVSPFIFRVHQRDDEMPKCALYEADGGMWKIKAVRSIAEYLQKELGDIPVIV